MGALHPFLHRGGQFGHRELLGIGDDDHHQPEEEPVVGVPAGAELHGLGERPLAGGPASIALQHRTAERVEAIRLRLRDDWAEPGNLRALIVGRGAAVGFAFGARTQVWNTFDAHRLLHWAGLQGQGRALELKQALLTAYHGRGENVSSHDVLLRLAGEVGLEVGRAAAMLASGEYTDDVRERTISAIRRIARGQALAAGMPEDLKRACVEAFRKRCRDR